MIKPDQQPDLTRDFPPVPTEAWEAKIHDDLKGADYEKRLIWKTPDGLAFRPYYREEDLDALNHLHALPAESPYVRGKQAGGNDWIIRQDIDVADPAKANELARKAVAGGVEALGLQAMELTGPDKLAMLLQGLAPEKTALHFAMAPDSLALTAWLSDWLAGREGKGSIHADPLSGCLFYGERFGNPEENLDKLACLVKEAAVRLPGFRTVGVNGKFFHDAGAGTVQELAFTLAQANEYLAALTARGLDADQISARMHFTLAVGSHYFLEVAKFRAMRMLWAEVVKAYQPQKEEAGQLFMHGATSAWNKTLYDPYVNMLRSTTEAMSAAIGGVDSLQIDPFDSSFRQPGDFSLRMARNQQIILKQEAYFNRVADPAAGSYYVETLTASLAKAAWELFVEVEEQGGFIPAATGDFILQAIGETRRKRDMDIALRRQVFVGTNQYVNPQERMLDKLERQVRPAGPARLQPYRGAQAFEALRLAVEKHEQAGQEVPRVYLVPFGDLVMRKARAGFSSQFFGVAGYQVQEGQGSEDPLAGTKAAVEAGAHVVVFCSSDEAYAGLAEAVSLVRQKTPQARIVVAGHPKAHLEMLQEAGVQHFIHLRSNVLEELTRLNELFHIKQ